MPSLRAMRPDHVPVALYQVGLRDAGETIVGRVRETGGQEKSQESQFFDLSPPGDSLPASLQA